MGSSRWRREVHLRRKRRLMKENKGNVESPLLLSDARITGGLRLHDNLSDQRPYSCENEEDAKQDGDDVHYGRRLQHESCPLFRSRSESDPTSSGAGHNAGWKAEESIDQLRIDFRRPSHPLPDKRFAGEYPHGTQGNQPSRQARISPQSRPDQSLRLLGRLGRSLVLLRFGARLGHDDVLGRGGQFRKVAAGAQDVQGALKLVVLLLVEGLARRF
jgi:hypothetical protein